MSDQGEVIRMRSRKTCIFFPKRITVEQNFEKVKGKSHQSMFRLTSDYK